MTSDDEDFYFHDYSVQPVDAKEVNIRQKHHF